MEHRYTRRLAIQSRLLLHADRSTFIAGVTKNISYGGLALTAGPSTCLKKNLVVRAAFMVDARLIILPSQVVRVDNQGMALMFTEETSRHRQILKVWLNYAIRTCATSSVSEAKQHEPFSLPPAT